MSQGRLSQTMFPSVVHASSLGDWDFDKSFEFGLSIISRALALELADVEVGRRRPIQ